MLGLTTLWLGKTIVDKTGKYYHTQQKHENKLNEKLLQSYIAHDASLVEAFKINLINGGENCTIM